MDKGRADTTSMESALDEAAPHVRSVRLGRFNLRRKAAAACVAVIALLALREIGIFDFSIGKTRSESTVGTQTSHELVPTPGGPEMVVITVTSLTGGPASAALVERLNGGRGLASDLGEVVGSVETEISKLEISGNSWLPIKKSIHAEFGLSVRTVLGAPDQPTRRSAQLTISGSCDVDALGLYSSRGIRRAAGEAIAKAVVRQIRAEALEAAKSTATAFK